MIFAIYLIIIILFSVLIFWTWNNSVDFEENKKRVKFIAFGILILYVVTLIIFNISKIGVAYPNISVIKQVRRITVLLFTPLNGYITLPHIAKIFSIIKTNSEEDDKIKKRIIILFIVVLIFSIIEIQYINGFQNGIINFMQNRK